MNEGLNKLWIESNKTMCAPLNQSMFAECQFQLDANLNTKIEQFAHDQHIDSLAILYAAWGLLLNHYSSIDQILFHAIEIDSAANSFPTFHIHLVNSLLEPQSCIDYIRIVAEQLKNKKYIKETDLEKVQYAVILNGNKEIFLELIKITNNLSLAISLQTDSLSACTLIFNNVLYDPNSIENIVLHFKAVLEKLCNQAEAEITTLNILSFEEEKQILTHWSHPHYPFAAPKISQCLPHLVSQVAENYAEQIAIEHNDIQLTYRELAAISNQLAAKLLHVGVQSGDHICVLMDRTPALIIAMLATMKCGAVYVPINPKYPLDRIEYVFQDANPKLILANDANNLPDNFHSKILILDESWEILSKQHYEFNEIEIDPKQIAYIIYTSGTTGKPKGVTIKHESLSNLIAWYQANFQVAANDHASQFASQAFDTFFCEVAPLLASGATVHIVDDQIKLTPHLFFAWLSKSQITICDLPTAYAQILFNMTWPEKTNLRILKIGGESINQYPTQKFSFDIWNTYGPTEATVETTYAKIYMASDHGAIKQAKISNAPPIGKALINSETYIVNQFMQLVPQGIGGELLIGGLNISPGYLNQPELTQDKFIDNPFCESPYKLYRTGDLVKWLADGNIEFIGRIDKQVKLRGYRIELSEIEHIISSHPDVSEVIVTVKENDKQEKFLIAYVIPNLDKQRYLYQERCILKTEDNQIAEVVTEDISKKGISLTGTGDKFKVGETVVLTIKLPGMVKSKDIRCFVIWNVGNRCGLAFDLNKADLEIISKSINFFLASRNIMDVLLMSATKRSLRKALKNKLPDYMIPSFFVTMLNFPLTFSGKIDVKALPFPNEVDYISNQENILPQTETEKKIFAIWTDLLGKSNISMADSFFDVGGNSLTIAQLSVHVLKEFGLSIPAKLLFDLPYVGILAQFIDSRGENFKQQTAVQQEIKQDCYLNEDITPVCKFSKNFPNLENILLTGAGGFLGIYLLRDLLKNTNAKIYCFVRSGEFESAPERLMSTAKKFNLQEEVSLANRRINIIPSDLCMHHFGIAENLYKSLLEKIDLIIHCGAQVNTMASYQSLRDSNVIGTLEIIKFATQKIDKPIHYVSTLSSAYLKDKTGNLVEDFPTKEYQEIYGGYAISKWVSECLLTDIKTRGLPVAIYRSGYISGQSDTGVTNLNDSLIMLIKGCIQLGYAPIMHEKITILPVDFVSRAIVAIATQFSTESNVYHIDHPTGIMWVDLVSWMNEYGYSVKLIPIKEWQRMLTNLSKDNALFPFLPHYLSMKEAQQSADVSIEKAQKVLRACHLKYPKINDQLLRIYFDYLCEVEYLSQPTTKVPVA